MRCIAWHCLITGQEPSHRKNARTWFERAAAQGDAPAQHQLGLMCAAGTEGKKDEVAAVVWFKRGAQSDYVPSMISLARALDHGRGTAKDRSAAKQWLEKAVQLGSSEAKTILEEREKLEAWIGCGALILMCVLAYSLLHVLWTAVSR
jgi:TPR repeat protein